MISQTKYSYDQDFPPLQQFEKKEAKGTVSHKLKVLNPTTRDTNGTPKKVFSSEEVLNWQSENRVSQNKILQWIDKRTKDLQSSQDTIITRLTTKIQQTRDDLMALIKSNTVPRQVFLAKEEDMKSLKDQYYTITTDYGQLTPPA